MALVVRDGNVTVTLDDTLERLARAAVEKALPGVRGVMVREVAQLADAAQEEWPVKTGKSRAGLRLVEELDLGRSAFAVRVRNGVDYAIFVKPKAWHGATTAWARLVRAPMTQLHRELAEEIGPAIIEGLRKAAT